MMRICKWAVVLVTACGLSAAAIAAIPPAATGLDLLVEPGFEKLAPQEQLQRLAQCAAQKQAVRDEAYLQERALSIYVWEQGKGDAQKELAAYAALVAMAKKGKPLEPLASVITESQSIMRLSLLDYLTRNAAYRSADEIGKAKIIVALSDKNVAAGPFAEDILFVLMVDAQARAAAALPVAKQGMERLKVLREFSQIAPNLGAQARGVQIEWALQEQLLHDDAWNNATAAGKVKLLRALRDQGLLGTPSGADDVYSPAVLPWAVTMLENQGFMKLDAPARDALFAKLLKDNVLDLAALNRLKANFADDAHRVPIENVELTLSKDVEYQYKDAIGRVQLLQQRAAKAALTDHDLAQAMIHAVLDYLQAGDDVTPETEMVRVKALGGLNRQRGGSSLLSELYNGSGLREGLGFELASVVLGDPDNRGDATSRAIVTAKWEKKTFEGATPPAMRSVLMMQMIVDKSRGAKFDKRGEARLRAQIAVGYAVPLWGINMAWAGNTALIETMWDNAEFRNGTLDQKAAFIAQMGAQGLDYNGSQGIEAIWLTHWLEADKTFMVLPSQQKKSAIENLVTQNKVSRLAGWEIERGMRLD